MTGRLARHVPAERRDDSVRDGQPEPGPHTDRLGGEERVEDPRKHLWIDAGTVVADLDHHRLGSSRANDDPVTGRIRCKERLTSVYQQVDQYLSHP